MLRQFVLQLQTGNNLHAHAQFLRLSGVSGGRALMYSLTITATD
jgi:hypothetical protein